jgi:hypothetical protein
MPSAQTSPRRQISQEIKLIFTEFKDTLDYILSKLAAWGFKAGSIHGSMNIGARDIPGTRFYAEQQFKDGEIQVLVATEAAGEGINLQFCHFLTGIPRIPGPLVLILRSWRFWRNQIQSQPPRFAAKPPDCSPARRELAAFPRSRRTPPVVVGHSAQVRSCRCRWCP